MIYYVRDLEIKNARTFKQGHYQFDYIEPDYFEKMQNNEKPNLIGCIKLKEMEKDIDTNMVVISSGLSDHYFKLLPPDRMRHFNKKKLIGYIMISQDAYVAVYKHSFLLPLLLSIAFLAVFSIIIL